MHDSKNKENRTFQFQPLKVSGRFVCVCVRVCCALTYRCLWSIAGVCLRACCADVCADLRPIPRKSGSITNTTKLALGRSRKEFEVRIFFRIGFVFGCFRMFSVFQVPSPQPPCRLDCSSKSVCRSLELLTYPVSSLFGIQFCGFWDVFFGLVSELITNSR